MTVTFVHHAEAVGPEVDPQRPLSSRGVAQAAALAQGIRAAGLKPATIWHSGKLRARQTAEACYRTCNPFADFRMVRGLRPDDSPQWIRHEIIGETRHIMIVSHMPLLPALVASLVPSITAFPLHGAIALERGEDGTWQETWRSEARA